MLAQQVAFLMEIEKLKLVERKTKVVDSQRHENSAEHSWQAALFALAMREYASSEVSIERVMTMLILHDVVEIDTGDVIAYQDNHHNPEEELAAAQRIFGLLPQDTGEELISIWQEFELAQSPDAQFAHAIDRCTPVLLNLNNQGQSWRAHGITRSQIEAKNGPPTKRACPALWQYISAELDKAEAQGWFDYAVST